MSQVWIYAELKDGAVKKVASELLGAARTIASQRGGAEVAAVLMGEGVGALAEELGRRGIGVVLVADDPVLRDYRTEPYAAVLADAVKARKPSAILFPASLQGKDLSARLAGKLSAPLATDCMALDEVDATSLTVTRPVYSGKARAKVRLEGPVQLVSFRPNVLSPVEGTATTPRVETLPVAVDPAVAARVVVKERLEEAKGKVELTEASIIVSGGRGMRGPENFALLEELASVLHAAVGASRAAVDAGWRDHASQVGQTGKTVSPNLYIACGISGSIQHMAGMGSSKYIVAINKDPEAPIFKVADYGIVGDLFEIVPKLTEAARKALA
ncbi:MAG TPA: electron transfer flavoprotein subunit alpha/FixB family protein [Thermodesulfobacteriota bacterium]